MPKIPLYDRVVKVTVTPATGVAFRVEGHDIQFDVEKTREPDPNKGKVVIFNLEENLRNQLHLKDDSKISIEAGYKAKSSVIFTGNIVRAVSGRQGADIVTTIDAQESLKAYRRSVVAATFGPGTPFKTVVETIVRTFEGFKITPQITQVLSTIGKSFPDGLTLDGPSAKVLTDTLRGAGLAFSMQNGEIKIAGADDAYSDPPAVLDYNSGLVDLPQLGEKKENGKTSISFKSLIRGDLYPGRKVELNWVDGRGSYKADVVKHKGSNFETEFYTTVEGTVQ